jgi:5-methyltetrahydropteroyltriglutamate--homocysteine methyltransferase
MKIKKLVYGIYPRSDKLRLAYGRYERGKETLEDLRKLIYEENKKFYSLTEGIEYVTDPLFNWYDIIRPIALSIDGITLGPLRRYFETNTFYREPVIKNLGKLKLDPTGKETFEDNPPFPMFHRYGEEHIPILPSPYSVYSMSKFEKNIDIDQFISHTLLIYSDILTKFNSTQVVIFSPFSDSGEKYKIYKDFCAKNKVILVTSNKLSEENFEGVNFKFESIVVPDSKDLQISQKYSNIPGIQILDSHNTKIETREEISSKLKEIESTHKLESIVVTHKDYMDFLPRIIADRKIEILKEVR